MNKYDSYKDSGVQWIGEIPRHWSLKRIKHTTYVKGRIGWKGLRSDEFIKESDSIAVTGTDFKNGKIDWGNCYQISRERYEEDPYIQLNKNDLLITKDGTIGKIALVEDIPKIATLNSGIFVTRPLYNDYSNKFLYWVLISDIFSAFYDYNKSGSTIQHLYQNVFNEFNYPLPSKEEQLSIVNYLNQKIFEIDNLITKKEKLIKLLEEEKTAVINQAVTKGLDPDVPMKDSGVEWLGKIPEDWEIWKLSHLYNKISSGTTPKSNNENYYKNGTINWLNTGDLNDSEIFQTSKKITNLAVKENITLKMYPENSVVIAMYGATIGKLGILRIPSTVNQACCVFADSDLMHTQFLFFWLKAKKLEIVSLSKGGGQPNISQDIIKKLKLGRPSMNEQLEILRHINNEETRISQLIEEIGNAIELLKEYKTALISEVVTGKVDVRDEVLIN